MRLRRRLIPPLFALTIAGITALPILTPWFSERSANLLSLGIAAGGFFFKSGLFGFMRQRMTDPHRRLTLFGEALVDYFSALVVLDVAMVVVFGTLFSLTYRGIAIPHWLTIANRSAINGGVALILGTGGAVTHEMIEAGERLEVHEDHASGCKTRRTETQ